jgi:hypothetical protein
MSAEAAVGAVGADERTSRQGPLVEIALEDGPRLLGERQHPLVAALAHDPEHTVAEVDVSELEVGESTPWTSPLWDVKYWRRTSG